MKKLKKLLAVLLTATFVLTPFSTPVAAQSFSATLDEVTSNSASISWSETGGATYSIKIKNDGNVTIDQSSNPSNPYNVSGLTASTNYNATITEKINIDLEPNDYEGKITKVDAQTYYYIDINENQVFVEPNEIEANGNDEKRKLKNPVVETIVNTQTDVLDFTTLAANEEVTTYTITFDSNGGKPVPDITDIEPGSSVEDLTEPTRNSDYENAEYAFLGWFTEENVLFTNEDTVDSNLELTAKWDLFGNATILITADDAFSLYVDGDYLDTKGTGGGDQRTYRTIFKYRADLDDGYVIAVKAEDLHGTIAGLYVEIIFDDKDNSLDLSSPVWKQTTDIFEGWYEIDFEMIGWNDVEEITPHPAWNNDAEFWGWTENNLANNAMDKIVYFRMGDNIDDNDGLVDLTIEKVVEGYEGDGFSLNDLAFGIAIKDSSATYEDKKTFSLENDFEQIWENLIPGKYTITEDNPGENWKVKITVDGVDYDNKTSFEITEDTKITVTNTYSVEEEEGPTGSLKVIKKVDGRSGNFNFDITITNIADASESYTERFSTNIEGGLEHTFINLTPGTYKITEDTPPQWRVTLPPNVIVFADNDEQSIEAEVATATVINTYRTPPRRDDPDDEEEEEEEEDNEITTLDEEPLPEAVPDPEPKPDNPNKPDTPNNDKIIELDEEPLAQAIPKTSGIPLQAFSLIGVALTGIGVVLRKKNS